MIHHASRFASDPGISSEYTGPEYKALYTRSIRFSPQRGSTLVWDEDGDRIVVRRAGLVSSEYIHRALFAGRQPNSKSLEQLRQGAPRLTSGSAMRAVDTN